MPVSPDRLEAALADRYTIERELGAGGMATVYLAHDVRHDRKVAVKVLRPELAAALGADRFLREIATTANLRHPHILPLYDSGEAGGFLFYVMPFVDGESLRDRLNREKQLPLDDALKIAREVGDALSYAHARNVVHRDVKPDNIMLEAGYAVVADFGIARAVSAAGGTQLTETGMSVGTPTYMSPEQAAGERDIDGRSDLYSLACVLYEMLGGQPPFTGPTVESVVRQHLAAAPAPVTNLRPAVPAAVAGTLHRALAKSPADRFSPIGHFVEALPLQTSPPISTPVDAPPQTLSPQIGRRRTLPLIAAVVTAAVVAVGVVVLRPRGGEPEASTDRVAVFPFAVRAANPQLAYLGEGVAELMATALDGSGDLRAVDPTAVFRRVSDDADPVDATRGESLARGLGAGRFVLGGVTDIGGGNIQLRASLYRAGDADPILVEQTGSAERPLIIVRAATAQLLAAALGRAIADSAVLLTTDSVGALKAYVTGATLYRNGQWNHAIAQFQRAVDIDPEFAMAYHKLSMAAGWAELHALSLDAGAAAVQLSGRLPERQRRILAAADAYHRGDPVEAERNALAVVEAYPDELEAWYILGETRVHYNQLLGRPFAEAGEPLERVAAGDPSRGDVWLHLYHLGMQARDVDRLEELGRQRGSRYYPTLANALVNRDTAVLDSLRPEPGFSTGNVTRYFEIAALWEDLEEGTRRAEAIAMDTRPPAAILGHRFIAFLRSAAGQRQQALDALNDVEPAMAGYMLPTKALLALDAFPAWSDSDIVAVRNELRSWNPLPMPGCEVDTPINCVQRDWYPALRLFLIGALSVRLGEVDVAQLYTDSLEAFEGASDAAVIAREKARTIRALAAEAAGDPHEALRLIEPFEPGRSFEAARDSPFGARSLENVITTRLLYATGQDEAALRRLGDHPPYYATWAKAREGLLLGEAHERLGQRDQAIAQYDRFLELWRNADAELQPLVEDVRGRISRLIAETN